MPARNCGHYLQPAVNSILAQTVTDLELIIIDDGSTDSSIAALAPDPRIRFLSNPGHGLIAALNSGAALARAPCLARMDGDDIALPERLERQIALLEAEPELGIVAAQVEIFTVSGPPDAGYRHYQEWLNGLTKPAAIAREIFVESPLPHPTIVLRQNVFKQLGGYQDKGWAEDYDLWLRAYQAGIAMAKPDGILLRWRDSPNRTSRIDSRYAMPAFIRLKAHYLATTILRKQSPVIWGAAATGALIHDALKKAGIETYAFIDIDDKKIGGKKRNKPVFSWHDIARFNDRIILGAVGSRGARAQIRQQLAKLNRQEGVDFWFVA